MFFFKRLLFLTHGKHGLFGKGLKFRIAVKELNAGLETTYVFEMERKLWEREEMLVTSVVKHILLQHL